ncbi:MAG TPA: hypothetical protein VFA12_18695 [Stellaceae bacterium]|nr:hypothetical protein [Stellaceae bacterium]
MALFKWLRRLRERNRLRGELTSMRTRDFGDLKVPPGLIVSEVRRWPWQPPAPQWQTLSHASNPAASLEGEPLVERAKAPDRNSDGKASAYASSARRVAAAAEPQRPGKIHDFAR